MVLACAAPVCAAEPSSAAPASPSGWPHHWSQQEPLLERQHDRLEALLDSLIKQHRQPLPCEQLAPTDQAEQLACRRLLWDLRLHLRLEERWLEGRRQPLPWSPQWAPGRCQSGPGLAAGPAELVRRPSPRPRCHGLHPGPPAQWCPGRCLGLRPPRFSTPPTCPLPPAMTATPAATHLREDLLTPRFYTTEIEKAARTSLEDQRQAFEAMLGEMRADYNREHFDRKAPLDRLRDLSPEEKDAYESYLVRSCVSEFSGFLLFKELSRRLKQAGRPELSELFQLMARDEARHAGFLNRALVAEGIAIDLPTLSTKRPITWFPLSWVLYSVYLSEKIGYWRYILIDRHLKANPGNNFAPLFDFFEPWCQDENRHGDIFNMLIRCWPQLRRGIRGKLLSRFFLWSVFLTHSLTVGERGNFYRILGMDPALFDAEVMRQTNRTASRAFPWVFDLESSTYLSLRDRIVDTFRQLKQAKGLQKLGLKLRFAGLLLRQFSQPMRATKAGAEETAA
jgi:magnesium-protoporphyrin IX monomethyl ester (oxidative) cyclase